MANAAGELSMPYMTASEIRKIESILLASRKNPIHILEWGVGGSTVHFTKFLDKSNIDYQWTSIEHNKSWYEKVKNTIKLNKKISLNLIPVKHDKNRKIVDAEEYINFPLKLKNRFDFILVDGISRPECLLIACKIINSDGVVVLHDAQRVRYHKEFHIFPYSRFIEYRLWVGRPGQSSFIKNIFNAANYARYRSYKIIVINILRLDKYKYIPDKND